MFLSLVEIFNMNVFCSHDDALHIFGPIERFSYFDVYLIETNRQQAILNF